MLYNTLFVIFGSLILTQVRAQDTTLTPLEEHTDTNNILYYYNIPIYSLHYNISEDRIPELAFELLIQDQFLQILSTEDVLNLLQSRHLIVQKNIINIDFARLMKYNISMTDFLHELILQIPDRKYDNMKKIANVFNVDFFQYQEYFMEQDEEHLYTLFQSGNYTEQTIEQFLAIINKTEEDVVDIITHIALNHMLHFTVKTVAIHYQDQLENLLTKQNISADKLRSYKTFDTMLNTFKDLLDSEVFWTTAVSSTSLVSVLNASVVTRQYNDYIKPYLINIENLSIETVDSITPNNTFTVLNTANDIESHLNVKYNPTKVKECYCIMGDELTGLSVHIPLNITINRNLILTENCGCSQKFGSPLICQKELYGILTLWDEDTHAYLTFSDKGDEEIPTAIPPLVDTGVGVHDSLIAMCLLFAIHLVVNL